MDNSTFERNQKNFFKKVEEGTEHVDQIPEMERFVKFWLDIQEEDDRTHELLWMESVSKKLRDKIANVKEFDIKEKTLEKEKLDCPWNRWHTKVLVEEVKTCKKEIEENT